MSFSAESAVKWVGDNPVLVGGAIFVVGLGALWATGFFGGGSSSGGASDASSAVGSYYAAVNADSQANAAEVISQQDNTATTAQTQIAADAYTHVQDLWANTALSETNSNNNLAMASLPYAEDAAVISTLGGLASLPPTTTTKQSGGWGIPGLFSIGGGTKTTTTANPVAQNASSGLLDYLSGHHVMTG